MDIQSIESVLQAGMIGEMPFNEWLKQEGSVLDLNEPERFTLPLAKFLAQMGVSMVRWELGDVGLENPLLSRSFLVLTLPDAVRRVKAPDCLRSTSFAPSLKVVHDLAVEKCGSFFYFLKGDELWIEYLVANTEALGNMEFVLHSGKIGGMPFPLWLEYDWVRINLAGIARSFAARGVTSVRWEVDEYEQKLGRWQAYLVLDLPMSSAASPPSLPSDRLTFRLAQLLNPHNNYYTTKVVESGVELWISISIKLPLDDRAIALLGTEPRRS